jgi:hypothetical protein
MNLILHIFIKDARRLWPQIAAFIVMLVWRLYNDPLLRSIFLSDEREMFSELLAFVSLYILIAALIHQEKLIGNRQYWLSRPILRHQLLIAKILFMATFISFPLFLGQLIALCLFGFPILQVAPIVLLKAVLFTASFALPIMALASITRNLAQMTLWAIAAFILLLIFGSYLRFPSWNELRWAPESLCLAILILGTATVLLIQYFRRTAVGRISMAIVIIAAFFTWMMPPGSWIFPIAEAFSNYRIDKSQILLSLDQHVREPFSGNRSRAGSQKETVLRIPIRIDAVPPGIGLYASAIQFTVKGNQTTKWNSKFLMHPDLVKKSQDGLWIELPMDSEFYKQNERSSVQIAGFIEMTLVQQQSIKIKNRDYRSNLGLIIFNQTNLYVYSPWPRAIIANETSYEYIVSDLSSDECAPWPTGRSFLSMGFQGSLHCTFAQLKAPSALLRRPVARIRRNFEFNNLRPHDYLAR